MFFDQSNKRTLGGDVIAVRRSNGGYLYADRAEITTCDMVADNGVVHGIDRVLLPEEVEPKPVAAKKPASRRNIFAFDPLDLFTKK